MVSHHPARGFLAGARQPDREEWLEVFSATTLPGITVHEVAPGHFSHGRAIRRAATPVRRTLHSEAFVEGWAHYAEELWVEEGFCGGDPRFAIGVWLEALVRVTRLACAIGVHSAGMTVAEAARRFEADTHLAVVTDHDAGRVAWIGERRCQATVEAFFEALGPERAKLLTHVSADGAEWIHPVVRKHAPQAELCLDAFHVVKWAGEKLDELRRRLAGELRAAGRGDEAAALGTGMWALRKDYAKLSPGQRGSLAQIAVTNKPLYKGCLIKEQIRAAFKARGGNGNGAAGSVYYPIVFINTSAVACTLRGYPGVSFVTGISGRLIGAPAGENATYPRGQVLIEPGKSAHAALQIAEADNYPAGRCHRVTARWLRVYPPGQYAPLYLSFTAQACSKASVRTLFVQTVRPGSGAAR